jgi:hypothetical protein
VTKTPTPASPKGSDRSEQGRKRSWHESLPFPRHWLAYIVIKLAVVCLAIYLVLRYLGTS